MSDHIDDSVTDDDDPFAQDISDYPEEEPAPTPAKRGTRKARALTAVSSPDPNPPKPAKLAVDIGSTLDPEICAMAGVIYALEDLNPVARARVLAWACDRWGVHPR